MSFISKAFIQHKSSTSLFRIPFEDEAGRLTSWRSENQTPCMINGEDRTEWLTTTLSVRDTITPSIDDDDEWWPSKVMDASSHTKMNGNWRGGLTFGGNATGKAHVLVVGVFLWVYSTRFPCVNSNDWDHQWAHIICPFLSHFWSAKYHSCWVSPHLVLIQTNVLY